MLRRSVNSPSLRRRIALGPQRIVDPRQPVEDESLQCQQDNGDLDDQQRAGLANDA